MYDSTPAPFGDVTRRWTSLDSTQRHWHAARLLGRCAGDGIAHVDRPDLDAGACYRRLVPAGAASDPIAVAWLATTHRPLLVARGRGRCWSTTLPRSGARSAWTCCTARSPVRICPRRRGRAAASPAS